MIESLLDERALHDWVIAQRWFASKSRDVAHMNVLDAVALRETEPELHVVLLEAVFPTGTHDVYQLPLGVRGSFADGVIAEGDGRVVYDAPVDPEQSAELVRLIAAGETRGDVLFRPAAGGPEIGAVGSSRPMGVEHAEVRDFTRLRREPALVDHPVVQRPLVDQRPDHSSSPLTSWNQ